MILLLRSDFVTGACARQRSFLVWVDVSYSAPHASIGDAGLVVDRSTVTPFKGGPILEVGQEFEEVDKAKVIAVRLTGLHPIGTSSGESD